MTNPYEPPRADAGQIESIDDPERWHTKRIQSLSNKSIVFGLLGLGCCGLIFGPLAISYANQAQAAIIWTSPELPTAPTTRLAAAWVTSVSGSG
ncbi:MAG TPA: hypothetical protein VEQ59_19405 [Polyangiaceae bacterium]|nr:hypothetical protein [Polyangiaceae bacterium]